MYPYLFVLAVVTGWVYLVNKSFHRRSIWGVLILLTVLPTIRNYTIGTDSATYTLLFRNNLNPAAYIFNPNIESGYQMLEYMLLSISSNYAIYFLICAVIVLYFNISSIKNLSENYTISIYCFICLGFYTFLFSGVRQAIAMAICMYAHKYIINNKKVTASLIIFAATFFHVSAFVMFIPIASSFSKMRIEIKALGCFITSIIGSSVLIKYMAESNERYNSYTDAVTNSGGYISLVMYSAIGLVLYIIGIKIRRTDDMYRYFEEFYICGMALLVPIALLGTDPSGPQRILYYFTWSLIILFPIILVKINSLLIYLLFIFFTLSYYYMTTTRFFDLYPFVINSQFSIF